MKSSDKDGSVWKTKMHLLRCCQFVVFPFDFVLVSLSLRFWLVCFPGKKKTFFRVLNKFLCCFFSLEVCDKETLLRNCFPKDILLNMLLGLSSRQTSKNHHFVSRFIEKKIPTNFNSSISLLHLF